MNLIQGTVDVMILKGLTGGPAHGFAISGAIRERSDGVLGLEDAALYQAKQAGRNRIRVWPDPLGHLADVQAEPPCG
mgnify:CR=1 FL=1